MSALHESLRHIFSVMDDFLNITLRNENLGKVAEKERSKISALLKKLYSDFEDVNPNPTSSRRKSSVLKDSKRDSVSSAGSSFSYPESPEEIAPTTVKALTNPIKIGFLQMKSMASKQKPYCVLHKNTLYWFSKPSDRQQEGAISVKDYEFRSDVKKKAKQNFTFELVGPGMKPFQFIADSREDLDSWKKAFDAAHEYKEETLEFLNQNDDGLTYENTDSDKQQRKLPSLPGEIKKEYVNEPVYSTAESWNDVPTYVNVQDDGENIYDTVGL